MTLSQPKLIDSILLDLDFLNDDGTLKPNIKTHDPPMQTAEVLRLDKDGDPFYYEWKYKGVIGKLNFLQKSTCPDTCQKVNLKFQNLVPGMNFLD